MKIILNKGIHLLLHYNKETEKNKMNLYEIDTEIMNCVDVETGEIFDIDKF